MVVVKPSRWAAPAVSHGVNVPGATVSHDIHVHLLCSPWARICVMFLKHFVQLRQQARPWPPKTSIRQASRCQHAIYYIYLNEDPSRQYGNHQSACQRFGASCSRQTSTALSIKKDVLRERSHLSLHTVAASIHAVDKEKKQICTQNIPGSRKSQHSQG